MMYTVTQINAETSNLNTRDARRAVTVTQDRINAIRAWMYNRITKVEAESSDWISVQPA